MTKIHLDPYDHAFHLDPYPAYKAVRDADPVHMVEGRGFWLLTTWDDVRSAFRDFKSFSSANLVALEDNAESALPYPMFINSDPPNHTKVRALFARLMTPEALAPLEAYMRDKTISLLTPHLPKGRIDFVDDLGCFLPMAVISTMIGVPEADQDAVRGWADDLILREDKQNGLSQRNIDGYMNLAAYFEKHTTSPPPDTGGFGLLAALLKAQAEGVMRHEEVVGALILLAIAGNETTTKLIGNLAYRLWQQPDQRQMLVNDPKLIPAAVEEVLRFDGSSQIIARRVARNTEIHGKSLKAGDKAGLCIISANRGGSQVPNPDRFDIRQATRDHMAFGFGLHSCLGAALARMEVRIVFEEILKRIPDYEIEEAGLDMAHNPNVRGYKSMPAHFLAHGVPARDAL